VRRAERLTGLQWLRTIGCVTRTTVKRPLEHRPTLRLTAMLLLVWSGTIAGAAQEAAPQPLALNAAVDLALRNHPGVHEAQAGARAASREIGVARAAYLPRLDFLWQVNRATRNNVFGLLLPQPVIPAVSGPVLGTEALDGVWSTAGGLLLSWEAIDFGRRSASVDVARADSHFAAAQREVAELEIASAAANAYLEVVAADAALRAVRANVDRLEVFAKTVRTLVANQLRAGAEQSRAEAELAAARTRLIEAQRNVDIARLALAEAIGVPTTAVAVDPGSLLEVPATPPVAAFDVASHPRAAAANAQADEVRARDRALERSYFPRVELQSAVAGRGVNRDVEGNPSGLGLTVPNWAIGLTVTFPSFEIFRTEARRRVEAERLQEASAHYDRTLQVLQAQEARARVVMTAALQIAGNTPQQLQAARDADTQARARYDAGLTTALEVAEAQRLLADAESANAVASLGVWRALLAEAVVKGDLKPFLDQVRAPHASRISQ
jgi:outer membrane protein